MAPPFPVTPVIKVEDEDENRSASGLAADDDQELRDKLKKDVQRLVQLRRRGLSASGSAQPQPPLPPLVQPPPPPQAPPPPPPPPAQHPWAKRPAMGPPPGFAGVRQPPLKQYQRSKPPGPRVPPAQPPQQPAPNSHLAPGPASPPPLNVQRTRQRHAPQPATDDDAYRAPALPAPPPPVRVGAGDLPRLQRRSAPKPQHPAARKKPTVPCALCGVLCMTKFHLKLHEDGRKHRNKMACLAGKMNVKCQVCNVHLSGERNVEEHMAGKQHLWRLNGGA